MNRLKARQWYRPVAPMVAAEALDEVFGRVVESPYMTMAPRILESVQARFPALAHLDGTARHQSVGRRDEPWVHSLLLAVGRKSGLAALSILISIPMFFNLQKNHFLEEQKGENLT